MEQPKPENTPQNTGQDSQDLSSLFSKVQMNAQNTAQGAQQETPTARPNPPIINSTTEEMITHLLQTNAMGESITNLRRIDAAICATKSLKSTVQRMIQDYSLQSEIENGLDEEGKDLLIRLHFAKVMEAIGAAQVAVDELQKSLGEQGEEDE